MIPYLYSYIASLLLVLIGERIIGGTSSLHYACTAVGLFFALLAILDSKRLGSNGRLISTSNLIGLCLLVLGGDTGQQLLHITDEHLSMWIVLNQGLGTLMVFSALFPLFALHNLSASGEQHATVSRSRKIAQLWLGTAFLLASLFPLNYIAHSKNHRWDVGYFKTAVPGESSLSLVDNLSEPLTVYLFFRMGMDVTDEVRSYFDQLPQDNLNILYVDKDKEPELAKELNIRENGMIALVRGEGENKKQKTITVGKNLSSAKRILKKLDEVFRENLLKLTQDASVLYFTTGHGELVWKKEKDTPDDRLISILKKGLRSANFTTKELSISNGLANEIPEDAAAVLILAPQLEFSEAEIQTLLDFWNKGHSLFIALEPDGAALQPLLQELGLEMQSIPLAHSNIFMPSSRRAVLTDQRNIVTNKFSTHPAVTTLARNNKLMQLVFSNTGSLVEVAEHPTTRKAVIKSLEDTWADSNLNYKQDSTEKGSVWNIAMTVEQENTTEDDDSIRDSKAIVFADSTWLTDNFLAKGFTVGTQTIQPHAVTLSDTLFWLTDKKENAGTVNNEQDIKIQHSKEGQSWIFFGSSLFIPLSIFSLGLIRIRRRRKGAHL